MIRGAVYRVNLGQRRGHEQGGKRYGLVLSPSTEHWSVATVIPTSTSAQSSAFRPRLDVAGDSTLFLVDQMTTVDVDYIVGDPVDFLSHDELAVVEDVVTYYLGL